MPLIRFMNRFLPLSIPWCPLPKKEVSQKSIFINTLGNHWCLSSSYKILEISSPNDLQVLEAKRKLILWKTWQTHTFTCFPEQRCRRRGGIRMCNLNKAASFRQAQTQNLGFSCPPSLCLCAVQAGKCTPVISSSCLEVGAITRWRTWR